MIGVLVVLEFRLLLIQRYSPTVIQKQTLKRNGAEKVSRDAAPSVLGFVQELNSIWVKFYLGNSGRCRQKHGERQTNNRKPIAGPARTTSRIAKTASTKAITANIAAVGTSHNFCPQKDSLIINSESSLP